MNKILGGCFLAVACSASAWVMSEEIVNAENVSMTDAEIRYLLGAASEATRQEILESPEQQTRFIQSVLAKKRLAEKAVEAAGEVDSDDYWALHYDVLSAKEAFTMAQFKASLEVPDMSVIAEEQYLARKEEIARVPEKRRVAHILLRCESGCDREEAMQRLNDLRDELAAGADFGVLAEQYSDDIASARNGGALSVAFSEGQASIAFPFRKASFALDEVGDLSPVVETQFGLHLIMLNKIEPTYIVPFEQLKAKIVELLEREWVSEQVAVFRASHLDLEGAEIDRQAFDALIDSFR